MKRELRGPGEVRAVDARGSLMLRARSKGALKTQWEAERNDVHGRRVPAGVKGGRHVRLWSGPARYKKISTIVRLRKWD
jgi:hypothetical protein